MSHFSKVKTKITRKSALVKALQRAKKGWTNAIEVNDEAQNLYGYQGDKREQVAEIIIRRKNVGASSNDLGFKLQADGTYEAIISDFDSSQYNGTWMDKLTQMYAEEVVKEVASDQGFTFESVEENGEIFVTCSGGF